MPTVSPDWLLDDLPSSKEFRETRHGILVIPTIFVLVPELLGERWGDHGESHWSDMPSARLKCVTSLCIVLRKLTLQVLEKNLTSIMDDVGIYGLVYNEVAG